MAVLTREKMHYLVKIGSISFSSYIKNSTIFCDVMLQELILHLILFEALKVFQILSNQTYFSSCNVFIDKQKN